MKKCILIILCACHFVFSGSSQGSSPAQSVVSKKHEAYFTPARFNKTDAVQQRLIGYRKNLFTTGTLSGVDSNTYTYSGNRGSVNPANLVYDVRQRWNLNAGNIVSDYRNTRTWNANGLNTQLLVEDFVAGSFENDTRTLYTYDANGNRLTALNQSWNGTTWDTTSKTDFVYNSNNQVLSETVSDWLSGSWEVAYRYAYAYDANNYKSEEAYLENTGSGLENVNHTLYTNDNNGNALTELEQNWNGSSWINFIRFTYSYANPDQQSAFIMESWTSGAWVKEDKSEFTYHSSGYFNSAISFSWNGAAWDTVSTQYFSYLGNNLVEDSTWLFTGGIPAKTYRTTYTYDANNYADTVTFYNWTNNSWAFNQRTNYDINGTFGNYDGLFKETWNGTSWQTKEQNYYYYETFNAPSALTSTPATISFNLYPNPTAGILNIDFFSAENSATQIEILSINGQQCYASLLHTAIGDNYLSLPVTELAAGLYVVVIRQPNNVRYARFYKS